MGRSILKFLLPVLLVVAAFLTAKYLDANPRQVVTDAPPVQAQSRPVDFEVQESVYQETTMATEPTELKIPEETGAEPEETEPAETDPQRRYVLTLGGDCTLGGNPGQVLADQGFVTIVGEDYQYPFRNIRPWLAGDDFTMVNLECVLTDNGHPVVRDHPFQGKEAYTDILSGSSVEVVSLANNHTMDYGETGYKTTCTVLDNAGISYVERDKSRIITLESGLTIGIYTSVYYKMDAKVIQKEIAALREAGADVVIFAAHWGYEGNYKPRKEEKNIARAAVDAGADIVYGTHPHVLQPVETYKNGVIFYSLGSLCYGGSVQVKDMDTALVQVELIVGEDGAVSVDKWTAVPCSISSEENLNNYQPTPYADDSDGYRRVMSKLDGSWQMTHN